MMRLMALTAAFWVLLRGVTVGQTINNEPARTVRAAGMPLQVSDLPIGTLTVRLVRGAFSENLTGRVVRLDIEGAAPQQVTTDNQGRATFRIAAGSVVHAAARIENETLESETFSMPPSGGVRVLLVSGSDDPAAPPALASTALPPGHPPIDPVAGTAAVTAAGDRDSRVIIAGSLTIVTLVGAAFALRRRTR